LNEDHLKSIFIDYIELLKQLLSQDIDYMPSIISSIEAIILEIAISCKLKDIVIKIKQDGLFFLLNNLSLEYL